MASVFATALEEEVGAAAAPVAAPAAAPLPPSAATAAASARTPARDAGAYRFGRRYTRGVREPIAPSDVRRLRSIDAYEREGELGSGAMARVFRARERATGVAVALKAFRSNQPCAASAEEADGELGGVPLEVLRECALLRSLRHPNIVSAHEVLTHAHAPAAPDAATAGSPAAPAPRALFLAMEAVDFDLGLLIEHMAVPFSEGQAKCLCQQLLCALAALEEQRIAHRSARAGFRVALALCCRSRPCPVLSVRARASHLPLPPFPQHPGGPSLPPTHLRSAATSSKPICSLISEVCSGWRTLDSRDGCRARTSRSRPIRRRCGIARLRCFLAATGATSPAAPPAH